MSRWRMRTALEAGEAVQGTWAAGIPTKGGRGVKYGGTLILTTRRLIWGPISLPRAVAAASMLGFLDGPTRGLPLGQIAAVRPDPDRHALLHVDGGGGTLSLLVGASAMTPTWSKKNRRARDSAVQAIRAALAVGH